MEKASSSAAGNGDVADLGSLAVTEALPSAYAIEAAMVLALKHIPTGPRFHVGA